MRICSDDNTESPMLHIVKGGIMSEIKVTADTEIDNSKRCTHQQLYSGSWYAADEVSL